MKFNIINMYIIQKLFDLNDKTLKIFYMIS
jgi:hypothetical protein